MSAFGGNTMQFGLRIGATDDTRGGLRSALASVQGFMRSAVKPIQIPIQIARGGLGLLRDINLGLAPLVRGLDTIIERGAAVEVQQKAFQSLTGETGRNADRLANSIVKAASGTVTLARGMQIANRAVASGMSLDQLRTAVEFISKFSVAIGKDAGESLNTVITGLARGSTLFLDDFGILVDGVDKVKADFDAIKGSGAFEQLAPAAQKAEIVRQAIAEMAAKTKGLGVSGRELSFVWQGLKNQISDGVDGIVATISKTGALREALAGVRDVLAGINEHFRGGGSFKEIFFGKGDSGGLLGIAKGALVDAGSAIGRGILGGLLKGIAAIPDLFNSAWSGLQSVWKWAMTDLRATLIETFNEIINEIKNMLFPFDPNDNKRFWGGKSPTKAELPKMTRKQAEWGAQSAAQEAAEGAWPTPARRHGVMQRTWADDLRDYADGVLSRGVLGGDSAFMAEVMRFRGMFPGTFAAEAPPPADTTSYRPTLRTRQRLIQESIAAQRALRTVERDPAIMREAIKAAQAEIGSIRGQGYLVGDREAREIRERHLYDMIERERARREAAAESAYSADPRNKKMSEQLQRHWGWEDEYGQDYWKSKRFQRDRGQGLAGGQAASAGGAESLNRVATLLQSHIQSQAQFSQAIAGLVRKLTGVEIELANAEGRAKARA